MNATTNTDTEKTHNTLDIKSSAYRRVSNGDWLMEKGGIGLNYDLIVKFDSLLLGKSDIVTEIVLQSKETYWFSKT